MTVSSYQVANYIIEKYTDDDYSEDLTNLKLQKLIFFLHVEYLSEYRLPLVRSQIEAWEHGPVIREIYRQFKKFGANKIEGKAKTFDPKTNQVVEPKLVLPSDKLVFLDAALKKYTAFTAIQLRNMSHVKGGPWEKARLGLTLDSLGGRISNRFILDFYGHQRKLH